MVGVQIWLGELQVEMSYCVGTLPLGYLRFFSTPRPSDLGEAFSPTPPSVTGGLMLWHTRSTPQLLDTVQVYSLAKEQQCRCLDHPSSRQWFRHQGSVPSWRSTIPPASEFSADPLHRARQCGERASRGQRRRFFDQPSRQCP